MNFEEWFNNRLKKLAEHPRLGHIYKQSEPGIKGNYKEAWIAGRNELLEKVVEIYQDCVEYKNINGNGFDLINCFFIKKIKALKGE